MWKPSSGKTWRISIPTTLHSRTNQQSHWRGLLFFLSQGSLHQAQADGVFEGWDKDFCLRNLENSFLVFVKNVFTNKLVWMNHLHIFIYSVNVSTGTGIHLARLSHSELMTYSPALSLCKTSPFISGEDQQDPYSTKRKHRGVWWRSELIRDKCKLRSLNPFVIRLRLSVETAAAEKFSMIP